MQRILPNKPSILILGASGGVAGAFLQLLEKKRNRFSNVILIDKSDLIEQSGVVDFKKNNFIFLKKEITPTNVYGLFEELKSKYNISIVLDLTDCDMSPILSAADDLGLSYLNCSINSDEPVTDFVKTLHGFIKKHIKSTHVLCLGMNPGILNHLIIKGVVDEGIPKEIVEIEYDSGFPEKDDGKPFITWSKKQFLTESAFIKSGYCGKDGEYFEHIDPAILKTISTKDFISPIKKLDNYPFGMIVPHEEILSMSRIMGIPGKFVYAIHPVSLERLEKRLSLSPDICESDVTFLDNINNKVVGSDLIGIWLLYENKKVCYFCETQHKDFDKTNATLFLVAVGVMVGILEFIENPLLENGVFFVQDLNNENFMKIVGEYLEIKKVVI